MTAGACDGVLGMNELITVKKYQGRWPDRRFIVVVMHNDEHGQRE